MTAIDKLISIAKNEIGYLEKKTNSQLDDKTANAGSNNYTKYWRDVKSSYQGQPWCACFVTWCFEQACGKEKAIQLLRHYPYVYCPNMANLFTLNANPKPGDIVIFYRNGEFAHTCIVIKVNGDYFETIEGNASGASGITPNGGGVVKKHYYNSQLPGTKFCTPDWTIVETEDLSMTQYEELKKDIRDLTPMIYDYIDENMPAWARPTIQKLRDKGLILGDENGKLGLTYELLKMFVVNDRAGLYD